MFIAFQLKAGVYANAVVVSNKVYKFLSCN